MTQGRKPGFEHSVETIEKIRQARLGIKHKLGTRSKISHSMSGKHKTPEHIDHLSESMFNLDAKCLERFNELKAEYPDQKEFFEQNREDLLFAMRDVKSEKELTDIRRYVECHSLHNSLTYEYSSSSCYAAEDAMIALVDAASFIRRFATNNP